MDEFIQLIRDLMQEVEENIDEFDDEELEAIHLFIQKALAFIQQEAGEAQQEAPLESAEPLPLKESMPSSNIHSYGYDDDTGELRVKFNGKDIRDGGPQYSFTGVPPQVFDLFRKGAVPARTKGQNKWGKWWIGKRPSAGASFYTLIREAGYPYKKVA